MDVDKFLLCIALLMVTQGCAGNRDTIRQGALTYNVIDILGKTPALALARAAAVGNTAEVRLQIDGGVDPNTVGKHDITPLWWAAWAENLDGFRTLLELGANPNFRRSEGFSLMILVTRMKDSRFLELALENGGDPNFRDVNPMKTPIFEAVMFPDAHRQLELLLRAGADLNIQDGNGQTPVIAAITARGDYKLVWNFLQRGADWRIKTYYGKTLADMVGIRLINPNEDQYLWRRMVIEFLRSKGIDAHRPADESPRKED